MRAEYEMTSRSTPLIALPSVAHFRETLPLCLGFTAFFSATYFLTFTIAFFHSRRFSVWIPWDASIPFVPAAALVYLSITPLLLLAPFIFRTRAALMPLFLTLCAEVVAAAPFFIMFPIDQPHIDLASSGVMTPLVHFADVVNLRFNSFPSLHVAFAVTAAAAYAAQCKGLGKLFFAAWAIAITFSTLLLHTHYILDVAGALTLATVMLLTVYARASRDTDSRRSDIVSRPIPATLPQESVQCD